MIGKFYPYGQEKPSATTNGTEKFTAYFRDAETSVDYAINRYHQPGMGRFLSTDPHWASARLTSPGTMNRYAYVGGDPVNYIDPLGTSSLSLPVLCGLAGGSSAPVCPVVSNIPQVNVPVFVASSATFVFGLDGVVSSGVFAGATVTTGGAFAFVGAGLAVVGGAAGVYGSVANNQPVMDFSSALSNAVNPAALTTIVITGSMQKTSLVGSYYSAISAPTALNMVNLAATAIDYINSYNITIVQPQPQIWVYTAPTPVNDTATSIDLVPSQIEGELDPTPLLDWDDTEDPSQSGRCESNPDGTWSCPDSPNN